MLHLEDTITGTINLERKGISKALALSYDSARWYALGLEALVILLAGTVAGVGYHIMVLAYIPDLHVLSGIGLLAATCYVSICGASGCYQLTFLLEPARYMPRVMVAWFISILLLTLILFLLKTGDSYSRGSVITFYVLAAVAIMCGRAAVGKYLNQALDKGTLTGRTAVLAGDVGELRVINSREMLTRFGITEVGRVTLSGDNLKATAVEMDLLLELARSRSADEIILAMSWKADEKLDFARHRLRLSPLPVRLLPDRNVQALIDMSGRSRRGFVIELQRQPLSRLERIAKRVFDFLGASFLITTLAPILLIVALTIKLDSQGPVIFRQRRKGFNSLPFVIYKFRTMTVLEDGPHLRQVQKGDSRITRFGRVLRRSSIDELPQLFNVLKGEMSLVGPRPHALAHDSEYGKAIAGYAYRHHMKPGITGWAQVNGFRGETSSIKSMEQRIEHDLWYINNWSFRLDLRILLRSCSAVFGDAAAY